jgi:hypothetical protein
MKALKKENAFENRLNNFITEHTLTKCEPFDSTRIMDKTAEKGPEAGVRERTSGKTQMFELPPRPIFEDELKTGNTFFEFHILQIESDETSRMTNQREKPPENSLEVDIVQNQSLQVLPNCMSIHNRMDSGLPLFQQGRGYAEHGERGLLKGHKRGARSAGEQHDRAMSNQVSEKPPVSMAV